MGSKLDKMVIKTETCSYSGFKFCRGKDEACSLMKRRNLTTRWTVHYRRINKKGISADENSKRRKAKKSSAVRRDIAGLPMELLAKAKAARPTKSSTAKDAALKEL